jgi:pimeloyl-ACP methyl ester carboxylesterase
MAPTRVFIHGLDSSSRGTKGSFFRQRFPEMVMNDYSGSLEERMAQLDDNLRGREDLILVGSSFGGLMATLFAFRKEIRVRRLILLAPALVHLDFSAYEAQPLSIPVTLYHGRRDTVVPPEPARKIASRLFANLDHHLVEDDHDLHTVFPKLNWFGLLEIETR